MTCRPVIYRPFVKRWHRPSNDLLSGHRLACGKPPFDPFLTASFLWTSHLCPVAAAHDLLHGRSLRPRREATTTWSVLSGDDWHQYIARLRLRVAARRIKLPEDRGHAIEVIRHDYENWVSSKHATDSDVESFWEQLVAPYVRHQIESGVLSAIVNHMILPEVTIGNWQVQVPVGQGHITYPIEARVDEIDLTDGVAIERTSLPLNQAVLYKDVQLVAAALILSSLPAAGIPESWNAVRKVRRFVLETPDGSVEITPSTDHFDAIHEAAAIIRDLAASHLAEGPIRDLAQCTPVNPHDICSHPYINCFYKVPTFPQSRAPIRRETRTLCRAELWELMWQHDLAKYRLYNRVQAGDLFPGLDLQFIKRGKDDRGSFVEARLEHGTCPSYQKCDLIIGTPFLGVRRTDVRFQEVNASGTIRFYFDGDDIEKLPLPNTGVLWPAIGEGLLLEGSFDFLIRLMQRDLFSHRKIGTSDAQRCQQESALQLLDAIFGGSPHLETN